MCKMYSGYHLPHIVSHLPLTSVSPASSLRLSFPHSCLFVCFVLWPPKYNMAVCVPGFGTIHWSLVHAPVGTQLETMTLPLPESVLGQGFSRWSFMGSPLIHGWLLHAGPMTGTSASLSSFFQWLCGVQKMAFHSHSLLFLEKQAPEFGYQKW